MILFYFGVVTGLIIIIAAVLALLRLKRVLKTYYPFIIYLWFAFINECITLKVSYTTSPDKVHSNIYLLLETYLLLCLYL